MASLILSIIASFVASFQRHSMTRPMKAILCWTFVLAALAGFVPQARADGKSLMARCEQAERLLNEQKIDDPVNAGFCLGYIGAIRSALQVLNSELDPRQRVCLPKEGVEVGQAIRIAIRFLRENPQRLSENEASLVIAALRNAYPCR